MYADPSTRRFRPVSFGAALVVNTAIMGGLLMFIAPSVLPKGPLGVLTTYDVHDKPPPEIEEVKPKPTDKPVEMRQAPIFMDKPLVQIDLPPIELTTTTKLPELPPPTGLGVEKGTAEITVTPPPPVLFVAASIDPRYSGAFQPDYPASEIRGGREGKVRVRVRIGVDGRVTAVEQVQATSDAFFDATRRHAMRSWRFKPATRGGKAEESWKTMNVTFVLKSD